MNESRVWPYAGPSQDSLSRSGTTTAATATMATAPTVPGTTNILILDPAPAVGAAAPAPPSAGPRSIEEPETIALTDGSSVSGEDEVAVPVSGANDPMLAFEGTSLKTLEVRQRTPPAQLMAAAVQAARPTKYRIEPSRLAAFRKRLNVLAWLETLLYSIFFPITLPLLYALRSASGAKNLGFHPSRRSFWIHLVHSLVFAAVVLVWMFPTDGRQTPGLAFWSLIVTFIMIRFVAVSPFAYLSPECFKCVMLNELNKEQWMKFDIHSWVDLSPSRAEMELEYTQQQLGVCLVTSKFIMHEQECSTRLRNLFVKNGLPPEALEGGKISLLPLLRTVMRGVVHNAHVRLSRVFGAMLSLIYILILARVFNTGSTDESPQSIVGFAGFISGLVLLFLQCTFMVSAILFAAIDNFRRYSALKDFSAMFVRQKKFHNVDDQWGEADPPLISLLIAENVRMYLVGRRVMQVVGQQFLKQWEMILGLIAIIVVIFAVSLVFNTDTVPVYAAIYALLTLLLPLLVAIFFGARINDLFVKDQALLRDRASEAWDAHQNAKVLNMPDLANAFLETERLLSLTADLMEIDGTLYPMRVLEFKATDTLIKSLVVSLFSFFSLVSKMAV